VRRIRHEVTTHRFEAHLARDVAHQQKLLSVAVRNDLQREVAVFTRGWTDDDGVGVVLHRQVARELRLAQEVLDAQAEVCCPAQVEKSSGHPVKPDDLALAVEDDYTVRKRGGRALQLTDELNEALLVEALRRWSRTICAMISPHTPPASGASA